MRVPTGRVERRILQAQVVELVPVGESPTPIEAITENVSLL